MCLLIWNSTGSLSVKFPQQSPTPCQSGRPSWGPTLHRLLAKMSDKGLSDDAAAAACKDGDPITKVRRFFPLKMNHQKKPVKPCQPNRPTTLRQLASYASITGTRFFTRCDEWFGYVNKHWPPLLVVSGVARFCGGFLSSCCKAS